MKWRDINPNAKVTVLPTVTPTWPRFDPSKVQAKVEPCKSARDTLMVREVDPKTGMPTGRHLSLSRSLVERITSLVRK